MAIVVPVEKRLLSVTFAASSGVTYKVTPVLKGKWLGLSISPNADEEVRKEILTFMREDFPLLFALRGFVISEIPPGSKQPDEELINSLSPTINGTRVKVKGRTGEYEIDLSTRSCTCPDFQQRRKGASYCKHLVALHRLLRSQVTLSSPSTLTPLRAPYLGAPSATTPTANLMKRVGGILSLGDPAVAGSYSHHRVHRSEPVLGVEFEVPECPSPLFRAVLGRLIEKGEILCYERDSSVLGGEIKLPPFPATLEALEERADLLRSLQLLDPPAFASRRRAGLHVHINVEPLLPPLTREQVKAVGRFFRMHFNLPRIFGRKFNKYAEDTIASRRYSWLNAENLPRTVEIRLGSSKGNPRTILLGALLIQRALWAVGREGFELPNAAEGLLPLFSPQEKRVIEPFIRRYMYV